MSKKYLFYAMRGKAMCFRHVLLNALDLHEQGYEVKIIFEGESVRLPAQLAASEDKLYLRARDEDLIAGVCRACATMLGSLEDVQALDLPLLDDMNGHAGMAPWIEQGYEPVVF